jgi:hypothetical protein
VGPGRWHSPMDKNKILFFDFKKVLKNMISYMFLHRLGSPSWHYLHQAFCQKLKASFGHFWVKAVANPPAESILTI